MVENICIQNYVEHLWFVITSEKKIQKNDFSPRGRHPRSHKGKPILRTYLVQTWDISAKGRQA